MLTRYNATLYFDSIQNAMDAGYCDAVYLDDDIPELGCQAVITFFADGYEVEPDEEPEAAVKQALRQLSEDMPNTMEALEDEVAE